MAKYTASPYYAVDVGESTVKFDYFGVYETDDETEIVVLDGLVPTWIAKDSEEKPEDDVKPKAPAPRKPSAK